MMRFFVLCLLFFSSQFSIAIPEADQNGSYRAVEWVEFVALNQVSPEMAAKKHRLMFQPKAIRFQAQLMSKPKPGTFTLAYDALQFWKGDAEIPNIDHSAFVGFEKGPVLGAYVTQEAAKMLNKLELNTTVTFYAMHIYNYSKGPRLVIVAAQEKNLD